MGTTLPDYQGRFLEGASGTVGQAKSAGLPNIYGQNLLGVIHGAASVAPTGSIFRMTATTKTQISETSDGSYTSGGYGIDASLSSSIYGNSETVQPASYTVNYLIKAY